MSELRTEKWSWTVELLAHSVFYKVLNLSSSLLVEDKTFWGCPLSYSIMRLSPVTNEPLYFWMFQSGVLKHCTTSPVFCCICPILFEMCCHHKIHNKNFDLQKSVKLMRCNSKYIVFVKNTGVVDCRTYWNSMHLIHLWVHMLYWANLKKPKAKKTLFTIQPK